MVYVSLKTPKSVGSDSVRKQIEKHIKDGKKTSEIKWKMEFVTTDSIVKNVSDKFQALKNKIAFEIRK
jgi:hypothetical protein